MESNVFIHILESEYRSMMEEATGKWMKNNGSIEAFVSYVPGERISRFKTWLRFAVKTIKVTLGGKEVETADAIVYAASLNRDSFSYLPAHPDLIKLLSIFSDEELDEIFGDSHALLLLEAIGRRI